MNFNCFLPNFLLKYEEPGQDNNRRSMRCFGTNIIETLFIKICRDRGDNGQFITLVPKVFNNIFLFVGSTNQLNAFHNSCLRRICKIFWPNKH